MQNQKNKHYDRSVVFVSGMQNLKHTYITMDFWFSCFGLIFGIGNATMHVYLRPCFRKKENKTERRNHKHLKTGMKGSERTSKTRSRCGRVGLGQKTPTSTTLGSPWHMTSSCGGSIVCKTDKHRRTRQRRFQQRKRLHCQLWIRKNRYWKIDGFEFGVRRGRATGISMDQPSA